MLKNESTTAKRSQLKKEAKAKAEESLIGFVLPLNEATKGITIIVMNTNRCQNNAPEKENQWRTLEEEEGN